MEITSFYILVENRYGINEIIINNYHLEKILERNKAIEIIEEESKYYNQQVLRIIVTNDQYLLRKYFLALEIDDLKLLCHLSYDNNKIKISKNFFENYNAELFKYFEGIMYGFYLSATTCVENEETFPYENETIGIGHEVHSGWKTDVEFNYFVTPARYQNDQLKNSFYLYFQIKSITVAAINNMFSIDIITHEAWEESKGYITYYNPKNQKRLYIQADLLAEIQNSE